MTDSISALTVARFLQENPDFFGEHAELFAALTVPHPNDTRAISLGERQILTLRDRQKELEQRLAILSHQANFNQDVAIKLNHWCAQLLAVSDPQAIPGHIVGGLIESFEMPEVVLKLWDVALPDGPFTDDIDEEAKAFAVGLTTPYCGPNKALGVARWCKVSPASLAIIPVVRGDQATGLLLLASPASDRFTPDMGTTFLESIGQLASAAIGRLPIAD